MCRILERAAMGVLRGFVCVFFVARFGETCVALWLVFVCGNSKRRDRW